ncbi:MULTISPECIES: endonuclease/exonuclease/phosphatase family protein [unclassified Methylophaga]|jgi:endonuclease/exonuclease/phosphatase family metal-dependent hydrolase|uniref:endonuclease/exonuclease/phosphatase family protein n=2 Tax=Methylophaga TaxID=40222 RepID=UPI0039C976F7|tara:strand:+ start:66 stop:437 length:372 start_codon:yes stop_codon:yes gene_type:complete
MGQFWKFLQIHRKDINKPKTLIIGDFNSNSIWDKPDRWWNHSDVVTELESIGISSVYHHISGEQQGLETNPTFYLHRSLKRPYHIDYIFASNDLLYRCALELSNHTDWLAVSDHLPLTVLFEN